jgi:ParB-like chromosome segregation protein Spo0J
MTPKVKLTDKVEHKLAIDYVPMDAIHPHPENARRGQVDTITESLVRSGQYRPLIVSRVSGNIVAGNHLYQAGLSLGLPEMPVTYLDNLSPEAERRILAIDNRAADLGTYDEAALVALLESLDSLEGTGYTQDDLETLAYLSRGVPELEAPDTDAHFSGTPEEQAARAENIGGYQPMGARGLAEVILVMPNAHKEQLLAWLETLRQRWGKDKTNGDLIYQAVGKVIEL